MKYILSKLAQTKITSTFSSNPYQRTLPTDSHKPSKALQQVKSSVENHKSNNSCGVGSFGRAVTISTLWDTMEMKRSSPNMSVNKVSSTQGYTMTSRPCLRVLFNIYPVSLDRKSTRL